MSYTYYGNIGDVWKHLCLCTFLQNEKPQTYIESNSAYAWYKLPHTPEQRYGIGNLYRNINQSSMLLNSVYYTLEESINPADELRYYLGSPGLALLILRKSAASFIFFDIEPEPLEQISNYATQLKILHRVTTYNQDSISGLQTLIPNLTPNDFIHIDPYQPFAQNSHGLCYFDIFLQSIVKNIPCMLWYGYTSLQQQQEIHKKISHYYNNYNLHPRNDKIRCIEIYLTILEQNIPAGHFSILGCGVIAANLTHASYKDFDHLSDALIDLYKGTIAFEVYAGDLKKQMIY